MTICFVNWSVNHVTNFGDMPELDAFFPCITVNVSLQGKNVLPTFLFGESRDKLRDWSVRTRDQLREDTRLADWI